MAQEPSNDKDLRPSLNGVSGRGIDGRFLKGNRAGRGCPMAKKVNQLRVALVNAVTVKDIRRIARKLIDAALAGDLKSIEVLFDRIFGKPLEADVLDQLNHLEERMEELKR